MTAPSTACRPESVVHLGDCPIIPAAEYEIRSTTDAATFTPPLTVSTVPQPVPKFWGDTVGEFRDPTWTPPNGLVTVNDFQAGIKKFQGEASPTFTWLDVHDEVPNAVINFTDIFLIVKAFQGEVYPFRDPFSCP
ncbi:MAG: hypothetical protein HY763_16315 [Planctomycetes bacterium]|nr:hypothetical protein [Planctomycetota bacterium]